MNTIKFSKEYMPATERHNLENATVREVEVFGKTLSLYQPCNLNISISNICQNRCEFCFNDQKSEISDELYFSSVKRVLTELAGKGFEITITGGEPTLFPKRLVETMRLCKALEFPTRTFSTTGIGLESLYEGKPICQHMIQNGFTHNINLSRMAISEDENHEIFKGQNISNKDIEKYAMFFKLNDAEMRISCNLIRGYVDTFEKVLDFVQFYEHLGVNAVLFRELEGNGSLMTQNPIIVKEIFHPDKDFTYLRTMRDAYYDVDIWKWRDYIIKHYQGKIPDNKSVIISFSLRNGWLMNGFKGNLFRKEIV